MMTVSIAMDGVEVAQVSARHLGPTSPDQAKLPDGEHRYQIRRWNPFTTAEVTHRHGDGPLVLAAKALAALREEQDDG